MITRFVKLTFQQQHVTTFIGIMNEQQHHIRAFAGCLELRFFQETKEHHVFFTISKWEDEAALDHYRFSEFFKGLWSKLKPMFAEKALAHSMNPLGESIID